MANERRKEDEVTALRSGLILASLVVGALSVMPAGSAAAAEEGTVNALASWQGQGRVFKTGDKQALFVGGFVGVFFVENDQGALHAARILCPGSLDIDLETGAQSGEGRCIITARGGDRVFARWTCSGAHFKGCGGRFTLTGGTGKFQGITGESLFVVKSALHELAPGSTSDEVREQAAGLAVWPELRYRIP